ncbi:MAG: hypothetical protein C0510_11070 [Erythrobacter sp.]|nr:hypothetical protein [Erythrobacter sp.]
MPKYCLDMSGVSNPAQSMPQDIHASLWKRLEEMVAGGVFATTAEVYEELTHIPPPFGDCITSHAATLVYEVGTDGWNWKSYISHTKRMQGTYEAFISERNNNRAHTVGLNDISVIALGKTLALPVVSMEVRRGVNAKARKGIPDICDMEGVQHMEFSDLLRAEGIVV